MQAPSPRPPARLLLADDHPLIRSGMRAQLEPLGRFEIQEAWDATSLRAAFVRASTQAPIDLALIDVLMPGMQGVGSLLELCKSYPHVAVLVVTGLDPAPVTAACRAQANIRGVIEKGRSAAELRSVVDLALAGVQVWPDLRLNAAAGIAIVQSATHFVASNDHSTKATGIFGTETEVHDRFEHLSTRQQQVARCVAQGLSNAQAAQQLGLTESTVKAYLKDIFRALGVSNRTQLALLFKA